MQTTLEFADGMALLMPLDPDVALLVLARLDANLGRLRLVTRRARGDLMRAVGQYTMWPGTDAESAPDAVESPQESYE